jgi:CHAT domain-containing protein/Tfp pilus assembly protein PilF
MFVQVGASHCVIKAQAENGLSQTSSLVSGQSIEVELKGGEGNLFTINLRRDEYLRVVVEQQGINVIVTLRSPSGVELVRLDLFEEIGPEPVSYVAPEAGEYRLEVRAFHSRAAAGRYLVRCLVKTKTAPENEIKMAAERSLVNARALHMGGEPKKALVAFQRSLLQSSKLDDKYWQAYALRYMAYAYRNLGDRTKAMDHAKAALAISKGLGDPLGEAAALRTIGTLYSTPPDLRMALTYFNQAFLLFRRIGGGEAAAYTLEDIGRAYEDLGEHVKALEYYRRALNLSRENGYIRQEAVALTDIGAFYSGRRQHQRALQFYEQALPVWRAANDRDGEAATLVKIGYDYASTKSKQKAPDYYLRALDIYKTIPSSSAGQIETLNYLVDVYFALGDSGKAIEVYRQTSELQHALGDHRAEANTLERLSAIYAAKGNGEEELRLNLRVVALWKTVGDRKAEAETLDKIADAYNGIEKNQLALEYYRQALALWRGLKNREREADSLRHIGGMYFALNEKKLSLEPLLEAQVLYQSLGDHGRSGLTLSMVGLDYYLLGEKERAWNYFEGALAFLKYPDIPAKTAEDLVNLPSMMVVFEDYEGALNYYQRVEAVSSGPANRRVKAIALTYMGRIHALMENSALALNALQQALSLFRALGDRGGEASSLHEIGKVHLGWRSPPSSSADSERGKNQPAPTPQELRAEFQRLTTKLEQLRANARHANQFFRQAQSLYQATQNHSGEGAVLISIGNVHQFLDNDQEAFDNFRKALLLVRGDPNPANQAAALYSLMDVCTDLSNPELAIIFGKQAVNQLQSMRSQMKLLDKSVERAFARQTTDPYRELASLLIKRGRLLEAEEVLEMLKEEEFFRFVRRDDRVANELLKRTDLSSVEVAALKRYNEIAEKIVALGDEFGKLDAKRRKLPPGRTASIVASQDALNKDLEAARITLGLFLDQLKKEFGSQDKRVAAVDEGLQAKVKSWKEPHTVAVSTIVGKDSLSMVLTTAETQRAFIIDKIEGEAFSEERLNFLIEDLRSATKDPSEDPRPSGQKLNDLLIKPLEKDLQAIGADTIVWSLDANLRYLPMAALYDSERGFLAERYASAIITLASHNNLDSASTDQSKWQALGLGVSKSVGGFPALINVPEELRAIVRETEQRERTGLLNGRRLLDEQFTLEALKLHLGHYNVIHAATHFSFKTGTRDESLQSFLLLGSGEKLTLAQVKDGGTIFNGVELLVLSACETAAGGKGADGREVEGFGVLAQKAGARTVMATLWPVADPSTRELMVKFYELHGSMPRITKAEALRRAQIALLRGKMSDQTAGFKPYAHPYYWAPFILIGNWK